MLDFFTHSPIDNMNERRALMRAARLLHERYGRDPDNHFAFIANIEPDRDPPLRPFQLNQLDGILLGRQLIAILEFKNYFQPIIGRQLSGPWYTQEENGRQGQRVAGGSHVNPYQQVAAAKRRWAAHLSRTGLGRELPWQQAHAFLLFFPYLHPDSNPPPLGKESYWFHLGGVGDISEFTYGSLINGLALTPEEMRRLALESFRARPWAEAQQLLSGVIGKLFVQEPGEAAVVYEISSYDELTIGRSTNLPHRIRLQNRSVSRFHARLEAQANALRLFDAGSKYGTFLNHQPVDDQAGALLQVGDVVTLGQGKREGCRLWFEAAETAGLADDPETSTATANGS